MFGFGGTRGGESENGSGDSENAFPEWVIKGSPVFWVKVSSAAVESFHLAFFKRRVRSRAHSPCRSPQRAKCSRRFSFVNFSLAPVASREKRKTALHDFAAALASPFFSEKGDGVSGESVVMSFSKFTVSPPKNPTDFSEIQL